VHDFEARSEAAKGRKLSPTRHRRGNGREVQRRLDQFYTCEVLAVDLFATFSEYCDLSAFLLVEPSAGAGSFFKLMPPGSLAYDIDPKCAGVIRADFLEVQLPNDRPVAVLGNPPFGKNCSSAIRHFNHAARFAKIIGFILPATFKKDGPVNRLDSAFHLLHEEAIPDGAFLFGGKRVTVPTVFQIWERRSHPRKRRIVTTKHQDFEFVDSASAHFAVQRVGARAGRVHFNLNLSANAHYFIRQTSKGGGQEGYVAHYMNLLDLSAVAARTAGCPSLAKSELIALYSDFPKACYYFAEMSPAGSRSTVLCSRTSSGGRAAQAGMNFPPVSGCFQDWNLGHSRRKVEGGSVICRRFDTSNHL
jgi:hypothetical protein